MARGSRTRASRPFRTDRIAASGDPVAGVSQRPRPRAMRRRRRRPRLARAAALRSGDSSTTSSALRHRRAAATPRPPARAASRLAVTCTTRPVSIRRHCRRCSPAAAPCRARARTPSRAPTSCSWISRRPAWPAAPARYAFLVGCGGSSRARFRVRQYFMVGHALERALLAAVRERARVVRPARDLQRQVVRRARCSRPGSSSTASGRRSAIAPHVDMLHPARRLWRGARPARQRAGRADARAARCRRSSGRCSACSGRATCPASRFPTRYFAFLRSGDASPLEPVLEHNRLDLVVARRA